jgi:hypothetical protein
LAAARTSKRLGVLTIPLGADELRLACLLNPLPPRQLAATRTLQLNIVDGGDDRFAGHECAYITKNAGSPCVGDLFDGRAFSPSGLLLQSVEDQTYSGFDTRCCGGTEFTYVCHGSPWACCLDFLVHDLPGVNRCSTMSGCADKTTGPLARRAGDGNGIVPIQARLRAGRFSPVETPAAGQTQAPETQLVPPSHLVPHAGRGSFSGVSGSGDSLATTQKRSTRESLMW